MIEIFFAAVVLLGLVVLARRGSKGIGQMGHHTIKPKRNDYTAPSEPLVDGKIDEQLENLESMRRHVFDMLQDDPDIDKTQIPKMSEIAGMPENIRYGLHLLKSDTIDNSWLAMATIFARIGNEVVNGKHSGMKYWDWHVATEIACREYLREVNGVEPKATEILELEQELSFRVDLADDLQRRGML